MKLLRTSSFTHEADPQRSSRPHGPWQGWMQAFIVLMLCVLSRLATTIHHIEDADSLRFALGVLDYDVTRLQPQFPGYTAFMGVVKLGYVLTGSYALAFSLVGGLGLFVLLHYSLALLRWRFTETRGLVLGGLFLFNPMVWLLGNRYMSDLSGAACMLTAFYHLSRTDSKGHVWAGFFITGLLAGWRLSYAPFLLAPLVLNFLRRDETLRARAGMFLAGVSGVFVWMIPLIAVTGWNALIETARFQTSAHFLATGGTYVTENSWSLRVQGLFGHVWTDGLGAWAPGRHPVTIAVAVGIILFLTSAVVSTTRTHLRIHGNATPEGRFSLHPSISLLTTSASIYLVWILLFQNVIHQTRHVLPLVPPLLMLLAVGIVSLLAVGTKRTLTRTFSVLLPAIFLIAYAFTGITLARQHMKPAAIAQAKEYVETFADSSTVIVAAPWIEKCLSAQGIKARFVSVETPEELAALPARLRALDPETRLAAVGEYRDVIHLPVKARRVFHHNPYVNRLGSKVEVTVYGMPEDAMP